MLLLQEIPATSGSIQPSTCRYVNCPHPGSVMPPGTHCVNLESRQCSDPKHVHLHYEPVADLRKVQQTPKGPRGLHGLGKHGEERYCAGCLEKMLEEHCRRLQREDPQAVFLPGHPIFEIAYWILGDQRVIPNRAGKFTLRSFKIYGIELWKARWLWNRRDANPDYVLTKAPGRTDMIQYLPGRYPRAIYLQPEDRNYRGLFDDNTVGEISSDEVDDCGLAEVLERLDAFAVAHEQLKALLNAARELAEKTAADARKAEYLRKINEKADRQKKWEEMERQSVVYRPRPRTVPILRCSTPTPPPESPKKALVSGDNTLRISSFPSSDALIPGQNGDSDATDLAKFVSANPPASDSVRKNPKRNHEGSLIIDGVDIVGFEGRGKPEAEATDPFEEADTGGGVNIRPRKRFKGSNEHPEDDKKPLDT